MDDGSPLLMRKLHNVDTPPTAQSDTQGFDKLMRVLRRGIQYTRKFFDDIKDISTLDIKECDGSGHNIFHVTIHRTELLQYLLETFKNHAQFEKCLHTEDIVGHTPVHNAVLNNQVKSFQMFCNHYENIHEICSSQTGKRLIHCAVESGSLDMVQCILAARPNALYDKDHNGKLPFHYAAELNDDVILDSFLEVGIDTMETDDNGKTALHFAVTSGSCINVRLLLTYNTDLVFCVDCHGETALHVACSHGYGDIALLLLENGADTCSRDINGHTPLHCAMTNKHYAVTKNLLRQPSWKRIVSGYKGGTRNCFVHLAREMPNAAKVLLDRCYECSELEPGTGGFTETYDFSFLEATGGNPPEFDSLRAILDDSSAVCLTHRVTRKFLNVKWRRKGFKIYMVNLLVYLIFHIAFNVYILTLRKLAVKNAESTGESQPEVERIFSRMDPFFTKRTNSNTSGYDGMDLAAISDIYTAPKTRAALIPVVFVVSFTVLNIIRELAQMRLSGMKYFYQVSNYLEWVLYICVLVFMLPVEAKKSLPQYFAGSVAVFFTWFNLIWFLRRLPSIGTYILTLEKVFRTLVKMLSIISLFCLAFASTFYLLLAEFQRFHNFPIAVLSTFVTMFGDFDYDELIVVRENDAFIYTFKLVVFSVFLLLMTIVVNNVLIGLAVGDTDSIMKQATLQSLRQQVKFIIEIDSSLSSKLPWLREQRENVYVESSDCGNSWLKKLQCLFFGDSDIEMDEAHSEESKQDGRFVCEQLVRKVVRSEFAANRKAIMKEIRQELSEMCKRESQ